MVKRYIVFGFISLGLLFVLAISPSPKESIDQLREKYGSGDPSLWPAPTLSSFVDTSTFQDIGPLEEVSFPEENPFSTAKATLGKILFFDPRISNSGQIACASCHDSELAWADGRRRSYGHNRQTGKRNAMTILNVAYADRLFWDGRAASLEDQAIFPMEDPLEMNEKHTIVIDKLKDIQGYKPYFRKAFGDAKITIDRIQKAIATFERTITSPKSRFDHFVRGRKSALTDEEVLGLHLFRTKAGCINCHNTPYFSDNKFHNDGQTLFGSKHEDFGLYHVTKNEDDIGKFRTPTLREVGRTGPWMHHGHFPTLLDVVQYYNLGNPDPIQENYLGTPRDSLIPGVSPILHELHMNDEEVEAVIAFLHTLSTTPRIISAPQLPK